MATFCGGIKLGNSLEVVNGIIGLASGTPTADSVVTVCGQQWDGEVFDVVKQKGADVVTIVGASEIVPLTTIKSNCGIKLDARYFDMSTGSAQFEMKYFLKVNSIPADATVVVKQGTTEIEPINGVYLVEDTKTYTVTVNKTGYVEFTDTVTVSSKDIVLDVELVLLSDAKAITAFSFAGLEPVVVGTINEEAKTIVLNVPNGTTITATLNEMTFGDLSNLVATFTNSEKSTVEVGEVAQESGVTANDFTTPVEYVVTAEDATTAIYTVTVNIADA